MIADPKPAKRIKDTRLVTNFSLRAGSCATCGEGRAAGLAAHHVLLRSRGGDDVVPNLVALCTVCHTAVHGANAETRFLLGRHIINMRPDVLDYLTEKLGATAMMEFIVTEYAVEA